MWKVCVHLWYYSAIKLSDHTRSDNIRHYVSNETVTHRSAYSSQKLCLYKSVDVGFNRYGYTESDLCEVFVGFYSGLDIYYLNENEKYSFLMTNTNPYILAWLGKFIYHIFIKRNEILQNSIG